MVPWSVAATCVAIVSHLTDEFQHRHFKGRGTFKWKLGDTERGNQQPSSEIKLCRNRCRCEGMLNRTEPNRNVDADRMSIIIKTLALGRESGWVRSAVSCKLASGFRLQAYLIARLIAFHGPQTNWRGVCAPCHIHSMLLYLYIASAVGQRTSHSCNSSRPFIQFHPSTGSIGHLLPNMADSEVWSAPHYQFSMLQALREVRLI